jgi:quercetin dioxygenase-like cupin family protein
MLSAPALISQDTGVLRTIAVAGSLATPADPTRSDYLTVISGEIEFITMDNKVTVLKQGDILVNASSAHKWRNATGKPCRGCGVGVIPCSPHVMRG